MWQPRTWGGLLLATCLVGCSQSAEIAVTDESTGLHIPSGIAQVMRPTVAIQDLSPQQQTDTIQIEGQVVEQVPLLAGSLYQLQDDSGTVWVRSDDMLPATAAAVRVVGTVQVEPIQVEGIDISDFYVQERDRQLLDEDAPAANTAAPTDAANSDTAK